MTIVLKCLTTLGPVFTTTTITTTIMITIMSMYATVEEITLWTVRRRQK